MPTSSSRKETSSSPEFKKGDWVAEKDGDRRPHFGQVVGAQRDQWGYTLNIAMYTWNGERAGRLSPPEGGPTSYEPCCPAEKYARIEKPEFPLDRDKTTHAYGHCLKFLVT